MQLQPTAGFSVSFREKQTSWLTELCFHWSRKAPASLASQHLAPWCILSIERCWTQFRSLGFRETMPTSQFARDTVAHAPSEHCIQVVFCCGALVDGSDAMFWVFKFSPYTSCCTKVKEGDILMTITISLKNGSIDATLSKGLELTEVSMRFLLALDSRASLKRLVVVPISLQVDEVTFFLICWE